MTVAPSNEAGPSSGLPRRIAFCITDLDVGGAEQCLVNVACGLDRRDWLPHVYCLSRRGALVDRLEQAGIPCTCLNWRGWRDAWRIPALGRLLRAQRPQLLQTFLFHGNLAGRFAGWLANVPIIVSGIRVAEREKHWHVRLERLTRGLVAHHVCVSQAVAEFSRREARLPPDTVSVIPNGVDVDRFANAARISNEELGAPPDTRWIIAVGRLHPQKGHRLLLDAVAPLLRAHPEWRLMIVGDGPLRTELEQRVAELGCGEQVSLLGFRNDVPRLLKTAEVLVLPSQWEGLPNVVLEAQAACLPVIAHDVEGVRELIDSGRNGLIVDPRNPDALRLALDGVMTDCESLTAMRRKLQLAYTTAFTVRAMSQAYAQLYERLLDSGRC